MCSVIKVQEKENGVACSYIICLPQEATTCDEILLPMNWLDIFMSKEHKEWILHFVLLETLLYMLSCLYLDLQVFLTFIFFIISCSPLRESKQVTEWWLSCQVGSTHDNIINYYKEEKRQSSVLDLCLENQTNSGLPTKFTEDIRNWKKLQKRERRIN